MVGRPRKKVCVCVDKKRRSRLARGPLQWVSLFFHTFLFFSSCDTVGEAERERANVVCEMNASLARHSGGKGRCAKNGNVDACLQTQRVGRAMSLRLCSLPCRTWRLGLVRTRRAAVSCMSVLIFAKGKNGAAPEKRTRASAAVNGYFFTVVLFVLAFFIAVSLRACHFGRHYNVACARPFWATRKRSIGEERHWRSSFTRPSSWLCYRSVIGGLI